MVSEVHATPGVELEVTGLHKTFHTNKGDVVALDGIDLTAARGEFVSVIGPSGCGKSTLFNIVAGLQQPTSGRVALDGQQVSRLLGRTAFMPQDDALFPWRNILDNTILGPEVGGMRRRDARREATALLERFGLGSFVKAYPRELSGGMRQRAAFLRTVLLRRPVMLLDEPFGALDSITRADMQQWLLDVWGEVGTTVLFITHDVAEAVFLSDRVYVISPRPGHVSTVAEIDLPRPRTLAVEEDPRFADLERLLRRQLREGSGEPHTVAQ
jgi:ABC-type nitrate/sulfonate/bicarbonate transport system ATPase subunit